MSTPEEQKAGLYALRDMRSTDFIAFREVAERVLVEGERVLDFGCGTGRSTRFLRDLGKRVTGVDSNPYMIAAARKNIPPVEFAQSWPDQPLPFPDKIFDSFFSSWVLLEEGDPNRIKASLLELFRILHDGGTGVVITNTPEFYRGDWVSCEVNYPENEPPLRSGQQVKVRLLLEGLEVNDYFWSDSDYKEFFEATGSSVIQEFRPLGRTTDPMIWKDEVSAAPYVIYQLSKSEYGS